MIKISTSILSAKDRKECINKLNNTNTDYFHIDVMDGKFVPNYQLPSNEINELKKYTKKSLDIHLMTDNPEIYIDEIDKANIEYITIHLEIEKDIDYLIKKIKELGIKVGISLKPKTNINKIDKYINDIDMVLIMSVEPGFGGQQFIEESLDRIKQIRNKRKDIIIEVDGGINNTNISKIKQIADIAVVGSYITNSNDYNQAINNLKN